MLKPLYGPASYLFLEYKGRIGTQFIIPAALSAVIVIASKYLNLFSYLDDGGFIELVNYFIAFVIGFFIAALAAVSSFKDPRMDEKTQGNAIIQKIKERGKNYRVILTRRQYLSKLFGYLSYSSIVLYMLGGGALLISGDITIDSRIIQFSSYAFYFFILLYSGA